MSTVAMDAAGQERFSFYETYIGKKAVMAATGVILFLYIVGHLAGNLQIFIPPRIAGGVAVYQINNYARFLHSSPDLLWVVRAFLIAVLVLHIWSSFLLWLQKRRARPIAYVKKDDVPSSYASRTMMWSGPIIAAFLVFHLLHLTAGSVGLGYQEPAMMGGEEQFFAYQNVVHGFRYVPVAIAYIVAILLLSMHLYHGVWSMFQSIGVSHPRYTPMLKTAAHIITWLIAIGYISIPVAVMTGVVGKGVL